MSSKRKAKPGAPAVVRGEPVVHGVLTATLAELGSVGYSALRIEDVAARAGVNKTTVYRRWPTKVELVVAALCSVTRDSVAVPDTGSLRGDLLAIGAQMVAVATSLKGRGIFRMVVAEGPDSELMKVAAEMRAALETIPRAVIARAAARGEIAEDADPVLLFDAFSGAIHRRIFLDRTRVPRAYREKLVDLLLHGATPRPRSPAGKPRVSPARDARSPAAGSRSSPRKSV